MTVAVKKWGNSLAFRIPKEIASSLEIENNSILEIEVSDGKLTVKPKKSHLLHDLISQIDTQNLHKEINTGENVGNEAW